MSTGGQQRGLVAVADAPEELDAVGAFAEQGARLVRVSAAGHQEPHPRRRLAYEREGLRHHREALAGFVEAPEEADGGVLGRAREPRVALGVLERLGVDAVGDDEGVPAEVLDGGAPRLLGNGDPGLDPLQDGPEHRGEELEGPGAVHRRVESRDHGAVGAHERQHRHRGNEGLVHVEDVEVAGPQPRAHLPVDPRAEGEARDRAVVGDGYRRPGGSEVVRRAFERLRGSHDADLVPPPDELLGQVPDVYPHASGDVPRIRAGDADPHEPSSAARALARARRSGSRSETKTL